MNRSRLAGALTLAVLLACGATAAAQDVGLAGTITDSTDAVLPGATVSGSARRVGQYVNRCGQ